MYLSPLKKGAANRKIPFLHLGFFQHKQIEDVENHICLKKECGIYGAEAKLPPHIYHLLGK